MVDVARLLRQSTYRARQLRRAQNEAEMRLRQALRGRQLAGAKFRRQHPIGPYIADFFCEQQPVVVELDGARHFPQPRHDVQRDAFMRAAGITLHSARQSIGARAATAAEAERLTEPEGAPLLTMQRTTFDDTGRAVEYGDHIYRPSRYSFEFQLLVRP